MDAATPADGGVPRHVAAVADEARVRLRGGGQIQGSLEQGIAVFRGIRYALPPFDALRFQAPQPVPAWQGTVAALAFAAASPQAPRHAGASMHGGPDCLALNIWAPVRRGTACPVMVWIPGGAYMRGDAGDAVYDGSAFARHGMVFVSLNYRVGIDGFLQIPGVPPNRGLLDQIAALQWIRHNIEAFGGDPAQVTVAGGSAGAGAIACLMGLPAARGLFNRAILQSPSLATQTVAEAAVAAKAMATLLDTPLTPEAIARVPLPMAVQALKRLADSPALRKDLGFSSRNYFPLRAVVDGEFLQHAPLQAFRGGWVHDTPDFSLLIGSNREEMRLYAVPSGAIDTASESELNQFLVDVGLGPGADAPYREQLSPRSSAGEVLCAMQTDYYYRVPARRMAADATAAGLRTYVYEFDWRSSRLDGRLGAAHGIDIPFVFDQPTTAAGEEIAGLDAPAELASLMNDAWARFVKQGRTGWPDYTPHHGNVMHFDSRSACRSEPKDRTAHLWHGAFEPAPAEHAMARSSTSE